MSIFPDALELGQRVVARRTVGRVSEIDPDGSTVTLQTLHGDAWPMSRAELVRPAISRDQALAILDRLAVPGSHDAPLPSLAGARALMARMALVDDLPEDDRYAAFQPLRAELDALLRTLPPEDLVDDVRDALAARIVARTAPDRIRAVARLHDVAHLLFLELALVTGLSPVEVEQGVARGHRASAPRELVRHAYLGSFTTQGPLIVSDFCYLASAQKLLKASLHGKPGRHHAWVSWSA